MVNRQDSIWLEAERIDELLRDYIHGRIDTTAKE